MFSFFTKKSTHPASPKSDVIRVAEKQLDENRAVIESLRDYDAGKKEIHTADLERRLRDVRTAS